MGEDDWLTLVEAAGLLGLSVRTIDRWARAGRLRRAVSETGSSGLAPADRGDRRMAAGQRVRRGSTFAP